MRGFSFASVLVAVTIALVAAFTLAALTTSGLNLARRNVNRAEALALAEAALNEAIGRLHARRNFGSASEVVEIKKDAHRFAILSFDPKRSEVPTSKAEFPSEGAGGQAHLIATASVNGVKRTVEALITIPPFQFALGSAGPLQASDGLEVSGVDRNSPGSLAGNSDLQLLGRVRVTGDLMVGGGLTPLGADDYVGGRILRGEKADLPVLDIEEWDPRGIPELADQLRPIEDATVPKSLVVSGARHTTPGGNLQVNGNLELRNGLLFVDGDLNVRGRMVGNGAVIVRGKTHVEGAVDVSPADASKSMVAFLGKGDVEMRNAQGGNYFQGLVYTEGSYTARQTEMQGVFVQAPKSADTEVSDRPMLLQQAKLKGNVGAAKIEVEVNTPWVNAVDFLFFGEIGLEAQRLAVGDFPSDRPDLGQLWPDIAPVENALKAPGPFQLRDYFTEEAGGISPTELMLPLPNWKSKLAGTRPYDGRLQQLVDGASEEYPLFLVIQARPRDFRLGQGPPKHILNVDGDGNVKIADSSPDFYYYLARQTDKGKNLGLPGMPSDQSGSVVWPLGRGPLHAEAISRAIYGRNLLPEMQSALKSNIDAYAEDFNSRMQTLRGPRARPSKKWSRQLDLSRFCNDKTPFRVVAWRERE